MVCGKKAADPTKATPADILDEAPAESTETTRDTLTPALLQALALKVGALSTHLDEQDNNKHKEQRDIPSDDDDVGEGGKEPEHDARTAVATGRARGVMAVFIDLRDWEALLPRAYQDSPPLSGATRPSLWRPRNGEADRYLIEANKTASRDEYRHMLLTYLRCFKAKKALTPEDQVPERLIYSRVFDITAEHERSTNVVDGLLAALEDKRPKVGLEAAVKAQASATFKRQATERDTDRDKARKEKDKAARERREQQRREADAKNRDRNGDKTRDLRRFTAAGAWEKSSCARWVSLALFVPKPGDNQWHFIIDLRVLHAFCARKRLRMETLTGVRHLTVKGDYMFSFDLQNGFYATGIAPSDRDYFTVSIRGTLYRLGGLPWVGR
eukprot:jgi/Tetstr1/425734/TSEL_016154.t1